MPAADSLRIGALPIGLAGGIKVTRPVAKGSILTWDDVAVDITCNATKLRREMEAAIKP